jgi:hypothetical protein
VRLSFPQPSPAGVIIWASTIRKPFTAFPNCSSSPVFPFAAAATPLDTSQRAPGDDTLGLLACQCTAETVICRPYSVVDGPGDCAAVAIFFALLLFYFVDLIRVWLRLRRLPYMPNRHTRLLLALEARPRSLPCNRGCTVT